MTLNTKIFSLKKHEWEFIVKYCTSLQLDSKLAQKSNLFILTLNALEQERLSDTLSYLFMSIGLKDNYEPNNIGLQIEELLDIFNLCKE